MVFQRAFKNGPANEHRGLHLWKEKLTESLWLDNWLNYYPARGYFRYLLPGSWTRFIRYLDKKPSEGLSPPGLWAVAPVACRAFYVPNWFQY
jgi:hypothetical protein